MSRVESSLTWICFNSRWLYEPQYNDDSFLWWVLSRLKKKQQPYFMTLFEKCSPPSTCQLLNLFSSMPPIYLPALIPTSSTRSYFFCNVVNVKSSILLFIIVVVYEWKCDPVISRINLTFWNTSTYTLIICLWLFESPDETWKPPISK